MVSKPLIIALLCVGALAAADMLWKSAPAGNAVQSSTDLQAFSTTDVSRPVVEKQDTVSGNRLENPLARTSSEKFDVISERTLFSASRKQPVAVLPSVQVPAIQEITQVVPLLAAPDPDDFTLLGIVVANQNRIALLRWNKTQEMLRLRSGDIYTGWKIAEINDRDVLIGQQGKLFSLRLFKSTSDPAAIPAQD